VRVRHEWRAGLRISRQVRRIEQRSVYVFLCCFKHAWRHCSRTRPGPHVHLVNIMMIQRDNQNSLCLSINLSYLSPVVLFARCVYVCGYVCMYSCMYLSICVYRTRHAHTHTHTHTQTNKPTQTRPNAIKDCNRRSCRLKLSIHDSVCIALALAFFSVSVLGHADGGSETHVAINSARPAWSCSLITNRQRNSSFRSAWPCLPTNARHP
jgi:hypothetical protein